MKHLSITALALIVLGTGCQKTQEFHVIPMPAQVICNDGTFCAKGAAVQIDENIDSVSKAAVLRFVNTLETVTGSRCKSAEGGFIFSLNPQLDVEEYILDITSVGARVEASSLNGFVYACETIKQMLPVEIYGGRKAKATWLLPCVRIEDKPRFAYRGVMLDASRHFWTVGETKRFLDVMAAYKMNRLHWHLTDDQGWRIEIKKYPKLTEIGAWRDGTQIGKDQNAFDSVRHGGFYTQEELRDIVDYASARGIVIIPEIDLPGHMLAALASYPQLGCKGGPYEVRKQWGISQDILCAGNEETFTFIENVLTEVMDIFPSEYIHIGGDECFGNRIERKGEIPWDRCPKCRALMKKLGIKEGHEARHYVQNYVTARVQKFLQDKGRSVIGWDEILEGELAPGATVMSWRGTSGGIKAVEKGMDVVMSPNTYLYIDYYQSHEQDKEPLSIGKYLPVENVYSYEPMEGMPEDAETHIFGVQCNLWTEYIATPEHLEYMLLPRMCAAAEIGWVARDAKDFERFDASLDHTFDILDAMGVNYCLDCRGKIGLDRLPARDSVALADYLATRE